MKPTKLIYACLFVVALLGLLPGALPSAQAQGLLCDTAPLPRLVEGQDARVTPGLPNALRSQPGMGAASRILAWIPGSASFTVLAGYAPQCANGIWWYYVSYRNIAGWTPEGSATGQYWTEPLGYTAPGDYCPQPARIQAGTLAKAPHHVSHALRSTVGGNESTTITIIPNGGVVTVLLGYAAQCANGMWWHYVSYNGTAGWLPEGVPGNYLLDPYGALDQCSGVLNSRLRVGGWGRVTPGLPNNLRSAPALASPRLGLIPAGGMFQVMNGPACSDGITWWQVNYNGVTGWTGEGRWGQYWLAPA